MPIKDLNIQNWKNLNLDSKIVSTISLYDVNQATCPGPDAVSQHDLVGTQFYDISWSGRSLMMCPVRNTVL